MAALLALTIALGMTLAVIFVDSTMFSSTPSRSTKPEKNDSRKMGPWTYPPFGTRV